MSLVRKMGRPRKPKTYRCGLLNELMKQVDRSSLPSDLIENGAGISLGSLANLRFHDPKNPAMATMEKLADFMGLEIRLVPKGRHRDRTSPAAKAKEAERKRKSMATRRGVDVPPELEADWRMLKQNRYTDAEAAAALNLTRNKDQKK